VCVFGGGGQGGWSVCMRPSPCMPVRSWMLL
jgi:hypothetical protein